MWAVLKGPWLALYLDSKLGGGLYLDSKLGGGL